MKYLFIAVLCIPFILFGQTPTSEIIEQQEPIVLNFEKNESGEIVLKVKGHTQQIKIQINGVEILNLYKEDTAGNLTQAGFESAMLAIDTKSGASTPKTDTQPPIPPVMSAFNPPLATPY